MGFIIGTKLRRIGWNGWVNNKIKINTDFTDLHKLICESR
jgi:hypothetical protein